MEKKRIIIVGGGISGLTAGIYGLDNNFDVEIYEKHKIAGGQCTGWNREGLYIDGCAHWIVGTNPKSDLNIVWKYIHAFNDETKIYQTEYYCKFDIDGEIVTFYADLEKLENEFLRVAPEDEKQIRKFIKAIKTYQKIKIPLRKPIDQLNIFALTKYGLSMLPVVKYLFKSMHTSTKEYSEKFKSPILREVFGRLIDERYNIHSVFYIMQALSKQDAGVIEGGSRKIAFNVKKHFEDLGGKIYFGKEVDHILIENNQAKGIVLSTGEVKYADYVIASTDAYHTVFKLLQGKYKDPYYEKRFANRIDNPLQQSMQISFKINKDMTDYPKMLNIRIEPLKIGDCIIEDVSIRNHAFDKSLYNSTSVTTILTNVDDCVYDYFKEMSKEKYQEEKARVGNILKEEIKKYHNLDDNEISLLDVTTPLTYEKYANAYRGSYMSFITTKKVKGLMRKGLIKGLDKFVLSGQWIMAPGGLPIAIFTGKHAIARICKMDKRKFIELDFVKK